MKKLIIILFLFTSLNCFSATRQELQCALDMVRFVNITNDLLDSTVLILNNDDLTIEEIKTLITTTDTNVNNYKVRIESFVKNTEQKTMVENGLNQLEIDYKTLVKDLKDIKDSSTELKNAVLGLTTKEQMKEKAKDVNKDIDKLPLIRKAK